MHVLLVICSDDLVTIIPAPRGNKANSCCFLCVITDYVMCLHRIWWSKTDSRVWVNIVLIPLFIRKIKITQSFPSQTHTMPLKSIWTLHVWMSLQKYQSKWHLCFPEPFCATGVLVVYIKVVIHIKNEHVPLTLDNRAVKKKIWSVYLLFIMFVKTKVFLTFIYTFLRVN